jgi:hypothetical protein
MGLIKKSVSDIERKVKYARYVMRVLKECHMVQDFIGYTDTANYKEFKERYMKKYNTSEVWYDYRSCAEILGSVNISTYYCNFKEPHDTYALLLAYLAIFDEEEYEYYRFTIGRDDDDENASAYIAKFLNRKVYGTNTGDIMIVIKWLKHKEALYGSKD